MATTEGSDELDRLVYGAMRAVNSESVSGVERCIDMLRYLKSLSFSGKDIRLSKAIHRLTSLRNHRNPKLRTEVEFLFNSWLITLFASGREAPSQCKPKTLPLKQNLKLRLKKTEILGLKKKKEDQRSHATDVKQNLKLNQTLKVPQNPRFGTHHQTGESLKKPEVCKSATSRPPLPIKKQPSLKISANPKYSSASKKNATEMLELFGIAKRSADVANAKGFLAAKAETSICVDTLALLMSFPISSTATETRRILEKLEHLTKHKDRKICNSALTLLHHWRQSISCS